MTIRLLALLLCLWWPVTVAADTILVFGQTTGANLVTGDETGGTTTLAADDVPITITTLDEAGVNLPAFFNLDATSTGPVVAVTANAFAQPYSGSFAVTSGAGATGLNYLSGLFTGLQLGIVGGQSFAFGSAQPPLSLTFSSAVPGIALNLPRAMALSLTNVDPAVAVSNGSFADFTSNVSGTFSAEAPGEVIPEPATLLLLGSGVLGLGVKLGRTGARRTRRDGSG